MGVDRYITLKIVNSKSYFSDLLIDFVSDFWTPKINSVIQSLSKNDIDDFNYVDYLDFETLKLTLGFREINGLFDSLFFYVDKLDEGMMINVIKQIKNIENYNNIYEVVFSPGIGKRLEFDDRSTDYEFYLNQIVPRLESLGCTILEIKCKDYDG